MNKNLYLTALTLIIVSLFSFGTCTAQQMTVNTKQDLDAGRVKIDSLDNQLMKILGERERIAQAIGIYKAKNHMPPLAEARFKEVLNKSIEAGKKEGLSAEFITELMNAIHKESLRIESDSTLMKQ
ncbi:MAG TPA: chorismate mutase [Mucilaginibacter sp.]|jgi:chorismate mutase|nr:chorismate mutase [Mucilaginibacter sp.]